MIDQTELNRIKALAEAATNDGITLYRSTAFSEKTYQLGKVARAAIPALIAGIERLNAALFNLSDISSADLSAARMKVENLEAEVERLTRESARLKSTIEDYGGVSAGRECVLEIWKVFDAITSAPPPERASEWRDITSAPRDGTPFDAWCVAPHSQHGVRFTDVKMRGDGSGFGFVVHHKSGVGWQYLDNRNGGIFPEWTPTLWQPLPASPSLPRQRTGGRGMSDAEAYKSVTVSLNGDDFLTIETGCLSGREIGEREEEAIRWAIDHLSGFIADKRHADDEAAAHARGIVEWRLEGLREAKEIAAKTMRDFLDPQYAQPQPMGSFSERFACGQVMADIGARIAEIAAPQPRDPEAKDTP